MATIRDVAKLAGVSTATVSRVMSAENSVRPATLEKVQRAIEELGYQPDGIGRALRARQSQTIALFIADIENPFLTAVIRGVESVAREEGFTLLLFNSDEDSDRELANLTVARSSKPAGIIITPVSSKVSVHRYIESGVPVVAVDRPLESIGTDAVVADTRSAARQAVQELRARGRKRVALITGPKGTFTAEQRLDGWREANSGLSQKELKSLVRHGDFKIGGGFTAAESLMAETPAPDALVVANSLMAVGAMQALQNLELSVGDDVALVAFDDAPWLELAKGVGVIHQPANEMGREAARLLIERIRGTITSGPRTVTLHPVLDFH